MSEDELRARLRRIEMYVGVTCGIALGGAFVWAVNLLKSDFSRYLKWDEGLAALVALIVAYLGARYLWHRAQKDVP